MTTAFIKNGAPNFGRGASGPANYSVVVVVVFSVASPVVVVSAVVSPVVVVLPVVSVVVADTSTVSLTVVVVSVVSLSDTVGGSTEQVPYAVAMTSTPPTTLT
jgi:hypothetical protein